VERTPLGESLRRLSALAGPAGIIRIAPPTPPAAGEPPLHHVTATTAARGTGPGAVAAQYGSGTAETRERALAAALGECAERYAASQVDEASVRVLSAAELGPAAAPPSSFALFHAFQYAAEGFPFVPFTAATRLRWSPAFRLPGGEPAFVPTQLAYLTGTMQGENPIGYATSSGMACGATLEEAVLAGLLELVERDAFRIAWENRLSLPLVDRSDDPDLVASEHNVYARTGLRYAVVDMSAFLAVPTALAVLRDPRGGAALSIGAASAPTMREAVRRSLSEAFQTRLFARRLRAEQPDWSAGDDGDIAAFEDRTLYYADALHAARAAFLDASRARVHSGAVAALAGACVTDHISALVRLLARAGTNVYVVDTTPPELRAADLRTVCVVAPELCRLDAASTARYLGGERLYRAAHELGLAASPLALDQLNPAPHPFP
jgi:ribosomal protein S12 methylthiotransferase accessory factor